MNINYWEALLLKHEYLYNMNAEIRPFSLNFAYRKGELKNEEVTHNFTDFSSCGSNGDSEYVRRFQHI